MEVLKGPYLYWNAGEHKPKTEKHLISNANLIFLKGWNCLLVTAALQSMSPTAWWLQQVHRLGSVCVCASFALNMALIFFLHRGRSQKAFTPLTIIATTLSPLYVIGIDLIKMIVYAREKRHGHIYIVLGGCALAAVTHWLTGGQTFSWFEDAVLVDVWAFIFFFLYRKVSWFALNMTEKDEIVRFFKTTCYDFIEKAPIAELAYSATTGFTSIVGLQMGKVILTIASRHFGLLAVYQSFFLSGVPAFFLAAIVFDFNLWYIQVYFRTHHRFEHLSAAQYLVKHVDHHDVIPVASIGSAGTGFQEAVHRSLSLWQYPNSALFGFNTILYGSSTFDEWSHNYCPTAKYSGILEYKHVHVDHHFNRTVPLGFFYDQEVEEDNFKYDESLWSTISSFMPGVELPEREDVSKLAPVYNANKLHWTGGPGWVADDAKGGKEE